jgi:hypothetical protein
MTPICEPRVSRLFLSFSIMGERYSNTTWLELAPTSVAKTKI